MRRWLNRVRRRAPRGTDKRPWNVAQVNALEQYTGDAAGEPHVRVQLQDLRGSLTRQFRADVKLRSAQAALVAAENALVVATERHASATENAGVRQMNGAGASPDVNAIAQRTSAPQGERALIAARDRLGAAERALQTAEADAIDRLVDAATRGMEPINAYVAAFNAAREYEGRPGIESLGDDFVDELVRRAIRPLTD